ncbi:TPA: type II toxin-antitoxin system ParD family antitoxin [Candidatus Woesearchaeota archaeon]|nr:type II toxin-antitoxin system ParD family antitoxin [Candidatus Woesearchaeota archaeon]
MSQLVQVRLPEQQVKMLDKQVKNGVYANRSEAIRDALRSKLLAVGTIPDTGDSVKEVRAIRKRMAKMNISIADINAA